MLGVNGYNCSMFVDGRSIQERIKEGIKKSGVEAVLDIVYIGNDPVIDKYISLKEQFGNDVGIEVVVHRLPKETQENEVINLLDRLNQGKNNGIIVQLPIPGHINRSAVLNAIDPSKDVDVLSQSAYEKFKSGSLGWLPPVVGA